MTDPHAPTTTGPTGATINFGHGSGALMGELLGRLLAGAMVMAAPVSLPLAIFAVGWGAATGMVAGGAIQSEYQINLRQNDIDEIKKLLLQNQGTLYKISHGELATPTEMNNLKRSMENLAEKLETSQCEIEQYQNDIEGYEKLAAVTVVIVGGVSLTVQELMAMSAAEVANLAAITKGESGAVDPNKLNHILGKDQHNLGDYLKSFGNNQKDAYNALLNATRDYVKANEITGNFKDIIVNVNGFDITVRGAVVDGIIKIGTAFIP